MSYLATHQWDYSLYLKKKTHLRIKLIITALMHFFPRVFVALNPKLTSYFTTFFPMHVSIKTPCHFLITFNMFAWCLYFKTSLCTFFFLGHLGIGEVFYAHSSLIGCSKVWFMNKQSSTEARSFALEFRWSREANIRGELNVSLWNAQLRAEYHHETSVTRIHSLPLK